MTKQPLKTIAGAPDKPLIIGDIEISCYVLEDEMRVLSQTGLQNSIGMSSSGSSLRGTHRIAVLLEKLHEKGINNTDLMARITTPIEFLPPSGGRTVYGYSAEILADIIEVVLQSDDAGLLANNQKHIAKRCRILRGGFLRLGVVGLIDETTGYQKIREQNALATILEKFIAKELQPWARTFPYEFYEQIFRLRGWGKPEGVKRPSVIGHYTNDIVYDRLAPGVLDELKRKNPKLPTGRRRTTHHQWFTPDLGNPKLKEHLAAVTALMRASTKWETFQRNLQRAFPKTGEQPESGLDNED